MLDDKLIETDDIMITDVIEKSKSEDIFVDREKSSNEENKGIENTTELNNDDEIVFLDADGV